MDTVVLNRKRASMKAQLTRMETFLEGLEAAAPSPTNKPILEIKMKAVDKIQCDMEDLKSKYYEAIPETDDTDEIDESFVEMETRVEEIQVRINSLLLITIDATEQKSMTVNTHATHHSYQTRLPEIPLPIFKSTYSTWSTFRQQFDNVITNNMQLNDSQRLHYLKASLQGEAKNLESADDNFQSLYQALISRYENKRLITETHVSDIFGMEKLSHESATEIRAIVDTVNKNLRALKLLDFERNKFSDLLLIHIILKTIDKETRKQYELSIESNEMPDLDNLLKFLDKRSQILQNVQRNVSSSSNKQSRPPPMVTRSKTLVSTSATTNYCDLCKQTYNQTHNLNKCDVFIKMKLEERVNYVKKKALCFNCLKPHRIKVCGSLYSCLICGKRHATLLHKYEPFTPPPAPKNEKNAIQKSETVHPRNPACGQSEIMPTQISDKSCQDPKTTNYSQEIPSKAIALLSNNQTIKRNKSYFPRAIILVRRSDDEFIRLIGLCDSCSDFNFLTYSAVNKLQLRKHKIHYNIAGLSNMNIRVSERVRTVIKNKDGSFSMEIDLYLVNSIARLAELHPIDVSTLHLPPDFELADNSYTEGREVDILLNSTIFFNVLKPGQIKSASGETKFQGTVFGYVAVGEEENNLGQNKFCGLSINNDNLETQLRLFWEQEETTEHSPDVTLEEEFCERQFLETHARNKDGRYIVKLPLKADPLTLGNSRTLAELRLNQLWKKLSKNDELKTLYKAFIKEYADLQHMELITDVPNTGVHYFLPHHCVLKLEAQSTKLRTVFNASAKTTTGVSLNDILYKGPQLLPDLFSILVRFREHRYVFTCDVQKMFRQILVHSEHQNLQLILWKDSPNSPVKIFKLCTVVYGFSSSPFLASRTLQQLAHDEKDRFPLASAIVFTNIYMDDILVGSPDLEEAKLLQYQLIGLFQSAGMSLHKWCSNTSELLENIPLANQAVDYKCDQSDHTVKTLGIKWCPSQDTFSFTTSVEIRDSYTKREVLSIISCIFDPLGILQPLVTKAKIILQKLWVLSIGWDDPLPEPTAREWREFVTSLPAIEVLQIPRLVHTGGRMSIYGFADASAAAYGAVIYIQSVSGDKAKNHLLCSKSRVAPIKPLTIPRLELNGCVLLSQLLNKVTASLSLPINSIRLYTDSSVALAWLKKPPEQFKTFICNRVRTIQTLTKTDWWSHVATEENPADLISRGLNAPAMVSKELWWKGPLFLQSEPVPKNSEIVDVSSETEYLSELRNKSDTLLTVTNSPSLLDTLLLRTTNYTKLLNIISFCFRFIVNSRKKGEGLTGPLSVHERQEAEKVVLRQLQSQVFTKELECIGKAKPLSGKSHLISLKPIIGKDGLLRVGGRLAHSDLTYDQKHPVIIPSNHPLSFSIMNYLHCKNLHIGPQALLYTARQYYWPIHGRSMARKIVYNCVVCAKAQPVTSNQIMGSLPRERVNPAFTFENTGVDFCGPFHIRYKHQRKGNFQKIYVAIFVCLATKAVHLEIVSDLTSDAFLATLKRFMSRRGRPATIWSDHGRNFVGTNQELKRLHGYVKSPDPTLSAYLISERINWKFIAPRLPHQGGIWEAGVKSFKVHMKRVVGESKLTFEEFLTIINQIEGILNSRPLTPLSSDIDDLEVLTPGHFLVGRPITAIIEPSIIDLKEQSLSRWQRLTKYVQIIWRKWSHDYLNTLQQRGKWRVEKKDINVGALVLIKEDNLPACKWLLGRVVKVYPGPDGKVRIVDLKTKTGTCKRGIAKICLLPVVAQ